MGKVGVGGGRGVHGASIFSLLLLGLPSKISGIVVKIY